LEAVDPKYDIVAIHDGVRPLIEPRIITAGIRAAAEHGASCVAVPVTDTIKATGPVFIENTVSRENLWAAQTPQCFKKRIIEDAFKDAERLGHKCSDDSSLVEMAAGKVAIVMGSYENIKITTPTDVIVAESILTNGLQLNGL
jgi:2-C-methyl-D-erythritol 4-phosphate cytidylyltransferase